MKTFLLAFVTLALFQGFAPRSAGQSSPEQAALQGKWEGVEVGRENDGKCTITIEGTSIYFQGGRQGEWYKATLTLPAGTDPKQLLGVITDCPSQEAIGKTAPAIYKVEEGKLTIVGHKPGTEGAPKSFDGDDNSRTFVLKKVQP
jgi:uncharacterized protein (TIGR03067 family)